MNSNENNALVFTVNNTEYMRISGTAGYVGIGTANPAAKLDVRGGAGLQGGIGWNAYFDSGWKATGSGYGGYQQYDANSGNYYFWTSANSVAAGSALAISTIAMTITSGSSGIGIGATSGASSFTVIGGEVQTGSSGKSCTSAQNGGAIRYSSGNLQYCNASNTWSTLGTSTAPGSSGDVIFNNGSGLGADTGQLYWDAANNRLGIGTNVPVTGLDVSGSIVGRATGTNANMTLMLNSASNGSQYLVTDHTGTYQSFYGFLGQGMALPASRQSTTEIGTRNSDLVFFPHSAEAARFTTSGRFGIGTTTPNAKLSIGNNVATGALDNYNEYQILLYDSNSATTSYGLGIRGNTLVANSAQNHDFDVQGVNFARISNAIGSTGTPGLKIGNSSYGWHSVVMDGSTSSKSLGILYGGSADNLLLFSRYADNAGAWEANPYSFDLDAPGGGFTVDSGANLYTVGNHTINNAAPVIVFQDTDQRNGVIYVNGNVMYFLSGNGTNGTSWTANGSYWPLTLNLNTDEASFGGNVSLLEGNLNLNGNAVVGSAGTVLDANGGWIRTYGTSGWFNGTYGGGMHMIDATWVRAYNSKALWSDTVVGSQGGFTAGFSGTFPPDSGGAIIAGNTGIGTASPKSRLDIADSSGVGAMTLGKEGGFIGYNAYYNGGWKYKTNGYAYILRLGSTGALEISSAPNNSGGNDAAMTPRLNVAMFNAGNMTTYGTVTTCTLGGGSGATNCTSDGRLKDRIKPVESAIEKLERINPVTFHWKDKSKDQREFLGLIAQNVETVFPQAVDEVSDTTLGKAKTLDYAAMVVPAIAAIKELNVKLDAENATLRAELKAANDNYDARLRALEHKIQRH